MNALRISFAAALLGAAAVGVSPAAAQAWYNHGPGPYGGPYVNYNYGPAYDYNDPGYETGESLIAVCPPGYHLGRGARLCWPD